VRVIAGRYGGRRLRAPRGRTTRPTAERVREAVYGMLGSVHGAIVLDLFAGSGAMGIEALSRGARRAVFVERDRAAMAALQANLAALGLGGERTEARPEDALRALESARKRQETYDLLLIDPPYGHSSELGPALNESLPALLAAGARVVVESDRRAPLQLELGLELELARERRYGDTEIRIYHRL